MSLKLVIIGFRVPVSILEDLRRAFSGSYEFETFDRHQFDPQLIRRAEVLVMGSADPKVVSAAESCKWIHAFSAGVEDYVALERLGGNEPPILTNSAGAYGPQISEHIFAMIFAFTRGVKVMVRSQERKIWASPPRFESDGELSELTGKTIGIVGLGHIGLEVAKRAKSFGLGVIGVRKDSSAQVRIQGLQEYVDEVTPQGEIALALGRSDIVVNCLPLTAETRGMFNGAQFARFKKGAIFVSVGRGATVVERDLVEALRKGDVKYAALDVYSEEPLSRNSPLWEMGNVLVSPHSAGYSDLLEARSFAMLKENLTRYSNGQPLLNLVDLKAGY